MNIDYHLAYLERGKALEATGEYVKAIKDYSKSVSLRPRESDAYYHRASVYSRQHEYKKSNFDYAKACAISPKYCYRLTELGICTEVEMGQEHLVWGRADSRMVAAWLDGAKYDETQTGGSVKVGAPYSLPLKVCTENGWSLVGKLVEFKLDRKWATESIRLVANYKERVDLTFSTYR